MILVVDNYDSFTYNVVQYLAELGAEVSVVRNDEIGLEDIEAMRPTHIVLSPGPRTPREAGITLSVIARFAGRIPIFGICLGHQAIGEAFGGKVVRAAKVMHGKTSVIEHDAQGVFRDLPERFTATRYHSLAIEKASLPACLVASAHSEDGEIMGVRHRQLQVEGVQFHPEALLSEHGHKMLQNFIQGSRA